MKTPTWEEKFAITKDLFSDACLCMREPGDWYVSVKGRSVGSPASHTESSPYGNGKTPEDAVNDDWRKLVDDLPEGSFVIVRCGRLVRRVRWTGYSWRDVRDPSQA